nr:DMT family transporter [Bacteroidota bacterium]
MNTSSSKLWNWSIMLLLAFIWGSSFILMKRGLEVFSYTQVADMRMGLAWLSLLPFVWKQLKKTPKHFWLPLAVVGLFGNGIPAFLFTKAQTQLDSSLTGILNALVPLFTLLIAVFVFKTKVKYYNILGILIGLVGAIWLIAGNGVVMDNAHYAWFVVAATICYAISLNTIKNYLGELKPIHITGMAFFFVGPPTLLHLLSTDFLELMSTEKQAWSAFGYILLLAVIGTS